MKGVRNLIHYMCSDIKIEISDLSLPPPLDPIMILEYFTFQWSVLINSSTSILLLSYYKLLYTTRLFSAEDNSCLYSGGVGGLDRKKILLKCYIFTMGEEIYTCTTASHCMECWLYCSALRWYQILLYLGLLSTDGYHSCWCNIFPGDSLSCNPVHTYTSNYRDTEPHSFSLVYPSACVPIRHSSDLNRRET